MSLDCLIIGAGPAGLTAAIYLARFHLRVALVDSGHSRAATIPRTRNHAGYPGGIAGTDLLTRMRDQAASFGAPVQPGLVTALEATGDGLLATTGGGTIAARTVLLATGVTNRRPAMADTLHAEALAAGALRYCPVCDGYEVTDTRVGVLGTGARGTREAVFLRSYTADLTLIAPDGPHALEPADRAQLRNLGVHLADGPATGFARTALGLGCMTAAGWLDVASLYPALGSDIHSGLARALGADCTEEGCVRVDAHQRTSRPGLYAAGDVVLGLDQISHAMGEAGVAATTIRNDLAAQAPLLR